MQFPRHIMRYRIFPALFLAALFGLVSCDRDDRDNKRTLIVTVTAYNTVERQTKVGDPTLAAWGDTLKPGMKAIAVSRDLIEEGLTHRTKVKIEGLPGEYIVLDKMNKRWKKRIDICKDKNIKAARKWGKKKARITWQTEP